MEKTFFPFAFGPNDQSEMPRIPDAPMARYPAPPKDDVRDLFPEVSGKRGLCGDARQLECASDGPQIAAVGCGFSTHAAHTT